MRAVIVQPWISYRGAETVSVLQTYWLQKLGNKVTMVCAFREKTLPPHATEISYFMPSSSLQRIFRKHKSIFYSASIPVLLSLLLRHRSDYDVVIAHNYPSLWVGALVAKMCSKKLIWYVHGVPPQSGFPRNFLTDALWKSVFDRIDIWSANQTDSILSVSNKIKREVKARYGLISEVVYPPIEYSLFAAPKRIKRTLSSEFDIPKDATVLLQVSSITKLKRADLSLEVVRILRQKGINLYLLFVGADSESPLLSDPKYAVIRNYIRIKGYVSADKLSNYYSQVEAVISPSKESEGCSVIALQALFAGTGSVVIKGSGVDEILAESGSGEICSRSPQKLAYAVEVLLSKKSLKNTRKSRTIKSKPSLTRSSKSLNAAQRSVQRIVDPRIHAEKLLDYAKKL